jgi:hypothetical protein
MMWAIIICTILVYCCCFSVTGNGKLQRVKCKDPLAFVFHKLDLKWMSGIVAVCRLRWLCVLLEPKWDVPVFDE